jgi:MFS family permease
MSRLRGLAVDTRPLRHRELRLLWIARGVSFFGTMVTYVAVPFQVYDLTKSTAAVGLVGVVELVAILGLAFLGGALADAHDRRRLVRLTEAALLLCSLALAVNASLDAPHLWPLYLLAGLMAGLDALQRPAFYSLLPRLVPDDEMAAASALFSIEGTIGMIGGPAIGGLLIAARGASAAYVFDVATFVVSLVVLRAMHASPPPDDAERPSFRGVIAGLRYAKSRQDLIGTYVIDFIAMVFGMPMALFPAVADKLGGANVLGLLYAAPAVGSLVASAASGWTAHVRRQGLAIAGAACLWGVGIVVFGLTDTLWVALVGLTIAGWADMVSGLFRMTLWNQTIPDHLRGRLASIELVSYSSGPALGNAEAGLAAAIIGVPAAIVSGGLLCIAGVVGATAALPGFRNYDAAVGPAVSAADSSARK